MSSSRARPDGESRGPADPLPDGGSFAVWLDRAQKTLDRCGYRPSAIADRLLAAEMFHEQGRAELALGQLEEALVLLRAFLEAEGQAASLPDPLEIRVERFLLRSLGQHRWLEAVTERVQRGLPRAPDVEGRVRELVKAELAVFRTELSAQARAEVRRWGAVLRQTLRRTLLRERAELEELAAESAAKAAEGLRYELGDWVRQEIEKVALELRDDQRVLRIVKRYVLTRDAIKESKAEQNGSEESLTPVAEAEGVSAEAPAGLEPLAQRLVRLEQAVKELPQGAPAGQRPAELERLVATLVEKTLARRARGGSASRAGVPSTGARKPHPTPLRRPTEPGRGGSRGNVRGSGSRGD